MATQTRTASYKGRTYRLMFLGATRFGRKAKLGFMDGSKEFWVPADQVSGVGAAAPVARPAARRTGCSCGSVEDEVRDSDCWTCRHDQQ